MAVDRAAEFNVVLFQFAISMALGALLWFAVLP